MTDLDELLASFPHTSADTDIVVTSGKVVMERLFRDGVLVDTTTLRHVSEALDTPGLRDVVAQHGLVITADRYSGVYSGGRWVVMTLEYRQSRRYGGDLDDIGASSYWMTEEAQREVGVGPSIDQAVGDFLRRRRTK